MQRDYPRRMATHRKVLLWIGLLIWAGVVALGAIVVVRLTAKPNIATDYTAQVHELLANGVRARGLKPDAAKDDLFARTVEVVRTHSVQFAQEMAEKDPRFAGGKQVDYGLLGGEHRDEEDVDPIEKELTALAWEDALREGIDDRLLAFRELAGATRQWKSDEMLLFQQLPQAGMSRSTARFLRVQLRKQLAANDAVGARETVSSLLALGSSMSGRGSIIESLVGLAIQAVALDAMRERASSPMPAPLATAMLDGLRERPILAEPELALKVERLVVLDTIQRCFSDDGEGDGRIIPREIDAIVGDPSMRRGIVTVGLLLHATRKETTDATDAYFDEAIAASNAARHERDMSKVNGVHNSLPSKQILLKMVLPQVDKFIHAHDRFETTLGATQLLIAIELYRSEHGAPPATLETLVPSVLSALPTDVFATDGKFRYSPRTPTPDNPRDFVLYSVGADGIDNGGNFLEGDKREIVLSESPEGAGFDWPAHFPN
jgi:hypothetical protein